MKDDVLAFLSENNQAAMVPLDLPSEDDLVCVEEELLIAIPHDLREYLLLASDVIFGDIEPVTAADSRSHTYLPEVASFAWDRGLSREYLPVCEYDGGYAAIAQDGKVVFWRDGALCEEWDDFWLWCREVWLRDA